MRKQYPQGRQRRKVRVRTKILEKKISVRLSVFRSNRYLYAQIIDDRKGQTLVAVNNRAIKTKKMESAQEIGRILAQKALEKGIKKVVFDRGAYRFHGLIKALAQGAREGGLKF